LRCFQTNIERDSDKPGAIVDSLKAKSKAVSNVIRKGLLREAAEFVKKGQLNPALWPDLTLLTS